MLHHVSECLHASVSDPQPPTEELKESREDGGVGNGHAIARCEETQSENKGHPSLCFSGIVLVSWLCLEGCLAAFQSAVILYLAV